MKNFLKRASLSVALISFLFLFLLSTPFAVEAVTADELLVQLRAQVTSLQAQVSSIVGQQQVVSAGRCGFARDLTLGSRGDDVRCLQDFLSSLGVYTYSGGSTGYFGMITRAAVVSWQASVGITPAAGYFGPVSRAKYVSLGSTKKTVSSPYPNAISIVAEGGNFAPKSFSVAHLGSQSLAISARDRNYVFDIPKEGIHYDLKAGAVTEISVSGLGEGVYTFLCGAGCGGTLTIVTPVDSEE